MNLSTLLNQLNQIAHVTAVETKDHKIHVTNALDEYDLYIDPEDIIYSEFVFSPTGVEVLMLYYGIPDRIIITPDDYVFNVEQDEFIHVTDAPPMCSIVEMITGILRYIENPMPSDNIYNCVGLFYTHHYIIKSAKKKGFKVDAFMDELHAIGEKCGVNVLDGLNTEDLSEEQ